jgi:DNA-directed RNA polymerase subunit beta'
MANSLLNPEGAMKSLEDGTINAVSSFFPVEGKKHKLVATNIYAGSDVDHEDVASQKKAKLRGRTWSVGVYADMDMIDKETGKKIDSVKGMKLLNLPKLTKRYSFIVDGVEYQADNQWRLKSGVYSRQRANGELEAQFNLAEGRGFRMDFYPAKRQFLLRYGTANIQLLPVLRALGVKDSEMRQSWGDKVFDAVAANKSRGDVQKLAKALDSRFSGDDNAAATLIKDKYSQSVLLPDTTKLTLGKEYNKVEPDTLLRASTKLLNINRGTEETDNRDSLRFKELWTIEDHIPERIINSGKRAQFKIKNNLDRKDNIRDVVTTDIFNVPVKAYFTTTSLAQMSPQLNPVEMAAGFLRTTIMGQGAISSDQAISLDAKMIDPSMLGVVDPVHTPEGNAGISTHLTLGTGKRGKDPTIKVYDTKSKKLVEKTPTELAAGTLAFPDQYEENKDGPPHPRHDLVTVIPKGGGDPTQVKPSEVDYIMRSPKSMFSVVANLVPFLPSDQANRAGMATRHISQAISLKERQAPLVQVAAATGNPKIDTWEKIVGKTASSQAPVDGTISEVTNEKIVIQGEDKKKYEVGLYDNYPLNEKKSYITSLPLVKAGDKVKKDDIIADTNFTDKGTLALGRNLKVAYLDWQGATFEDAIVVSEKAAKDLTSLHQSKPRVYLDKGMSLGLSRFRANFPGVVTDENAKKLDENGVIKKGQVVKPGDVIMTVLKKTEPSPEQVMLKGIHKALAKPYKNSSVVWDSDYSGTVTDVAVNGNEVVAYVTTEEPLEIADKLSNRHGGKGVVSMVVPTEEMPKNAAGEPIDIIVSPMGVPGRINIGQVLETMLGKVAHEKGTTFAVDNFQTENGKKIVQVEGHYRTVKGEGGQTKEVWVKPHTRELGYQDIVKEVLAQNKVDDTEELFDPQTKKSFGKVLTGFQYFIKLTHQVDKKMAGRSHGYGNDYDATLIPKGGGDAGAQRYGELGLYAMLAHGATNELRDTMTYKSDKAQQDVWTAIQTGEPLPAPKNAFAYDKFVAYLRSVGLDIEKDGNEMRLVPFTDDDIKKVSNGALTDASKVLRGKDLRPEPGGLFDEKITGGPGGKNFAHIPLEERIPNPVFERAIMSLLGVTGKEYDSIISGDMKIDGKTGPSAIVDALAKINVDSELKDAKEDLKTARRSNLDAAYKRVKYLTAIKNIGKSADKAYSLSAIPVIPPVFRPITSMEGGDLNVDGVNLLYRDVAMLNEQYASSKKVLPESALAPIRKDTYEAVSSLIGIDSRQAGVTANGEVKPPGILTILSGRSSPKESYVHTKLMDRRQDLTGRSVITPDQTLGLDQLGLPKDIAYEIYRPFAVSELTKMGYTPLAAREELAKRTPLAERALEIATQKRPVFFKRDPVLHKFGIMAFYPKLHEGKSIKIHPLVTGGFNADFDGDTMAVFVPVSSQAVDDAKKMLPSNNLFNFGSGKVEYQPSLGGQLGLYLSTQFGKDSGKVFSSMKDVVDASNRGEIAPTDVIKVDGKKTTAGRIQIYAALPDNVRTDDMLTDPGFTLEKKNLQKVMKSVATKAPAEFAVTMDKLKNIGFRHQHDTGFSYSAADFDTLSELRDSVLKQANAKAKLVHNSSLSQADKDKKLVQIYTDATVEMTNKAKPLLDKSGSKLYAMNKAGTKPAWEQVQQMILAPMLLANARGRVIPAPVTRSYAEGLDTAGYWTASSGARKGLINKVQSVQKPGVLSKQIINATVPYSVTENDCGTTKAVALDIDEPDVIGRVLPKDVTAGGHTYKAGTVLTTNVVDKMKQAKVSRVAVRSVLKCQAKQGLCQKCFGEGVDGKFPDIGTNLGVLAGQSIGERGTQLAMKEFHLGGLAGTQSRVASGVDRVFELLKMPETLPNAATLSTVSGKVQAVNKSPLGGFDIKVAGETHYVPGGREPAVKAGDDVEKGARLSTGTIDPRELMDLTGTDQVQRYMTDELHGAYASEGIKRRNAEVVVKAMTNLSRVVDPGDSDELIRGDMVSTNYAEALNREKGFKNPIVTEPVLRGLETLPLDRSTDWMARLQYRKLKDTYLRGAAEGWRSDIHGMSPVPGLIYSSEFGKPPSGSKSPY